MSEIDLSVAAKDLQRLVTVAARRAVRSELTETGIMAAMHAAVAPPPVGYRHIEAALIVAMFDGLARHRDVAELSADDFAITAAGHTFVVLREGLRTGRTMTPAEVAAALERAQLARADRAQEAIEKLIAEAPVLSFGPKEMAAAIKQAAELRDLFAQLRRIEDDARAASARGELHIERVWTALEAAFSPDKEAHHVAAE